MSMVKETSTLNGRARRAARGVTSLEMLFAVIVLGFIGAFAWTMGTAAPQTTPKVSGYVAPLTISSSLQDKGGLVGPGNLAGGHPVPFGFSIVNNTNSTQYVAVVSVEISTGPGGEVQVQTNTGDLVSAAGCLANRYTLTQATKHPVYTVAANSTLDVTPNKSGLTIDLTGNPAFTLTTDPCEAIEPNVSILAYTPGSKGLSTVGDINPVISSPANPVAKP